MSSRQQILERIRAIRQNEQKLPDELPDRILPLEELRERFIVSCSITGTGVHVLSSVEEATLFFRQQAGSHSFYIGPGLAENSCIEDPVRTEYALLKGEFGVAENNAVWLRESCMGDRVIPFASLHLYLLVAEDELVADMHEAYHKDLIFQDGFGVFIAGPSKTADIEQSLVIGAHGPLSLDILLITNHQSPTLSFLVLLFSLFPFQVHTGQAQGTTYTIKYVAERPVVSQLQLDSLFQEINLSLSLYEPHSLINKFNREGKVRMDVHLYNVVTTAMEVYTHSHGAFDITSLSVSNLWGFGVGGQFKVPKKKLIRQARKVTGSKWLAIEGDTLIALKDGVKIDCNGIAQGYTVDEVTSYLEKKGISDMLVELGGEIRVKGQHPETGVWKIGMESAAPKAEKWYPVQEILELSNAALTTSGGNRKFFTAGKKRYSHIINPSRGKPVKNDVLSVSVQATSAMLADAWDNTFMVMGVKKSSRWLKKQQDITAWIRYKNRRGEISTYTNKG